MTFDVDKWMEEHVKTGRDVQLQEHGTVGEGSAVRPITIIESGWGSSGYYPREVLERDGPRVFPSGTHMYLNHPTVDEEYQRPERDVKDLVGVVEGDPFMAGGKLKGSAKVFKHYQPFVNEVAPHIGLSIRAAGEITDGEREGKSGPIIESLHMGISVDYVTVAGAGGSLTESSKQLLESARSASARLAETLASDIDEQLRELGKAQWSGDRTYVYVDDYDPDANWVIYSVSLPNESKNKYYRVSYGKTETGLILAGEPVEVARTTQYQPLVRPQESAKLPLSTLLGASTYKALFPNGQRTSRESGGGKDGHMAEVSDQELSEIRESVRQHETKLTELTESRDEEKTRADRAEDALFAERARNAVNEFISENQEGDEPLPEIPDRAVGRIKESVLGSKLPKTEEGKLDTDRLGVKVREAYKEEAEYLGIKQEGTGSGGSGNGHVHGMGRTQESAQGSGGGTGSEGDPPEPQADEATEKSLGESFSRLGMSEDATKVAVKGR